MKIGGSSETADSDAVEMEIRTLCAELRQLLSLVDAEYSVEVQARIRVFEREVQSLTARVRHVLSKTSSLSL